MFSEMVVWRRSRLSCLWMHCRRIFSSSAACFNAFRTPFAQNPVLSSHSSDGLRDARLVFLRRQLRELRPPDPAAAQRHQRPSASAREPDRGEGSENAEKEKVEVRHPRPEWTAFVERLFERGYLLASNSSPDDFRDSHDIQTACLNFARDRVNFIRYFSRRDIQIISGSGCPNLDKNIINSGKRLRAHTGIEEGDVCSQCSLRGSCEMAYVKAREDEGARTIDVMRILLTFGLNHLSGSVENHACLTKRVVKSIKNLLNEVVEFSSNELANTPNSMYSGQQGKVKVPMKQGDWICPKCDFMNFARNVKCLRCNGLFLERIKMLRNNSELLPLKKGDWICEICNFFNFAKNTKCLQCHEKPKRQLNLGEWQCLSCNYINFRRNFLCLKCDQKRPKASNGELLIEHLNDGTARNAITLTDTPLFVSNISRTQVLDNLRSTKNEGRNDGDTNHDLSVFTKFGDFPISGGTSVISQNALAREKWKLEMLKMSKGFHEEKISEKGKKLNFSRIRRQPDVVLDDDDDEMAEWFGGKSGKSVAKV